MKETVVQFGDARSLVGVLAEPSEGAASRPTFILLNAGTLHRIGPHRVYVKIARALATVGFPVLRFDLSGLGDSLPRRDNLPYPASSVRETREAMDFLRSADPTRHFILMGLCGGADVAFRTACQEPAVVGTALVDWFAYRTVGWYMRHFRSALTAPWKWKSRLGENGGTGSPNGDRTAGAPTRGRLMNDGEVPPRPESAANLGALIGRGVQLLFVYTGAQLAYYNYSEQLRHAFRSVAFRDRVEVDFQGDADHTLTLLHHQQRLVETIQHWAARVSWDKLPT